MKRAPPSGESPTATARRGGGPAGRRARGPGPSPAPSVPSSARERLEDRARARASGTPGAVVVDDAARGARRSPRSDTRTRPPARPWRAAFSTQVVDEHPQARLPAADRDGRLSGSSARPAHAGMARRGRADDRVDELGEVDGGVLERRRVAARERLQAVEQVDEPAAARPARRRPSPCAARRRQLGVAARARQRRLHARQRRAQLVARRRRRSGGSRRARARGRPPSARAARASR